MDSKIFPNKFVYLVKKYKSLILLSELKYLRNNCNSDLKINITSAFRRRIRYLVSFQIVMITFF